MDRLGEGEYEVRRKFLHDERQQEYQEHLKRTSVKEAERVKEKALSNEKWRLENENGGNKENIVEPSETEPKEGSGVLTENGHSVQKETPVEIPSHRGPRDEKYERQAAYAEDLRRQIQMKKELDDERKRKEKAEDELHEKRHREYQEQLKKEYYKDHQDPWKQQREMDRLGNNPFGDGEHESRKKFLHDERQHDYQEHLKRTNEKEAEKVKEKELLNEVKQSDLEEGGENSISETDGNNIEAPAVCSSPVDKDIVQSECDGAGEAPVDKQPNRSSRDEKHERQAVYAEELRRQIEIKKELDNERKKRELDQDNLQERRDKENQERSQQFNQEHSHHA